MPYSNEADGVFNKNDIKLGQNSLKNIPRNGGLMLPCDVQWRWWGDIFRVLSDESGTCVFVWHGVSRPRFQWYGGIHTPPARNLLSLPIPPLSHLLGCQALMHQHLSLHGSAPTAPAFSAQSRWGQRAPSAHAKHKGGARGQRSGSEAPFPHPADCGSALNTDPRGSNTTAGPRSRNPPRRRMWADSGLKRLAQLRDRVCRFPIGLAGVWARPTAGRSHLNTHHSENYRHIFIPAWNQRAM